MQIGLAREIEEVGYATARSSNAARIEALLNDETAVEYIAGRAHQLSDLLHTTFPEFGDQSLEVQARLILIGFNQGWENWILRNGEWADVGLRANIQIHGFGETIRKLDYDNETYDEYIRWRLTQ